MLAILSDAEKHKVNNIYLSSQLGSSVKGIQIEKKSNPEPMINNRTAKELAYISFKRGYEGGSIISHQRHMHSVLGAISFAFFLALFSAGEAASTEILLKTSEVSFAIGLISNALLFFHYQATTDRKDIWDLDSTIPMTFYKTIALSLPILGTLLLIWHYYMPAAVCAVITAILGGFIFKLSLKASLSNDAKFSEYQMALIEAGRYEDYEKSKDRYFAHRLSEGELTINSYKYKVSVDSSNLPEEISLHHQVAIGDIIRLSESEKYIVLHLVHSKNSTTLNCKAIVECAAT